MQFRILDRYTLQYKDGGYVRDYDIDDDYIVNNNSVINIIKPVNAIVGDIIGLIETSGVFHKGVITTVDNPTLQIKYKADKELFNDNMLNPVLRYYADEDATEIAGVFGVEAVAHELDNQFGAGCNDPYKQLPIKLVTEGEAAMLWKWSDDTINIVDWLTSLFEDYQVTVRWFIDFDTAAELDERRPCYVVTVSAITSGGFLIKDNVAMQTITYSTQEIPQATVCYVIDSETKETLNKYYLYDLDGEYAVSSNISMGVSKTQETELSINLAAGTSMTVNVSAPGQIFGTPTAQSLTPNVAAYVLQSYDDYVQVRLTNNTGNRVLAKVKVTIQYAVQGHRVLPVKTVVASFNSNSLDENITEQSVAEEKLIPSRFNQAIEIRISTDSKMFDFETAVFGNQYKIVNERGTVDSVYSGLKLSSKNKWATLLFGLGRQNYTDLIQIRLRRQHYKEVYGG